MKSSLAVRALESAVARRGQVAGCIVRSDRGSRFRSREFVTVLARHSMIGSMGRVGAAGANAAMERFFALLQKNVLDRRTWTTRQELRTAIVIWIERTPETPGPIDPRRVRDHHDPTRSPGCIEPAVTRSCSSPVGVIALSGTRSGERSVKTLPVDAQATAILIEWTASGDSPLDVAGLDLRGADLSGADLTEGLFTESVLRGVNLSGSDLYRSHLEGAELEGANLSEATLVKAVLDESSLAAANLDRADLGSVEAWAVDARGASFRSAKLDGAGLLDVKLQGADLSNASAQRTSFQVFMDEQTTVLGLTGTIFGPVHVTEGSELRAITGADLEAWLNSRGAHVQVLPPLRG